MRALERVREWPVDAAAVGVLAFRPVLSAPSGQVAVVGTAGLPSRRFPWASVTKPVTALAVLVAVEEGTLSLEAPAGPPGSTVAHLLAHASGLGPGPGPPMTGPGRRRIYSNAGYDLLADRLAERAGLPFERYVEEGVLAPLGMSGCRFGPGADRGGGVGPDGAGPAAAGLSGTLDDLLALASEWSAPTLVSPETHARAVEVAFPGLAGVVPGLGRFDPCDWALGVELRGSKRPHWSGETTSAATVGHFGRSGSFFWVDPVAGVACAGLSDRPFGPWALDAWPRLGDAVLAEVAGGAAGDGQHV
jgi:CubicO group peptidase (beta-lactamase class C family)